MDKFKLIITIPSLGDKYDDALDLYLRNKPYSHFHRDNGVVPERVVVFGNIPGIELVNKIKNDFKEMYEKHHNANVCNFNVQSEDGYLV